jgi:putative FmdB family regulatory protein
MPIYEYRCEGCGHRFERWQKMSDPDPKRCPECKRAKVERLISAVGFRLKGGGWYETDFKKDHRRNLAGESEQKKSGPDAGKDGASKDKTGDKSTEKKKETKKSKAGEAAA